MGMTYAHAFLRYKIVKKSELLLVEKSSKRKSELEKLKLGKVTSTIDQVLSKNDVIFLAVKPQDFNSISEKLKRSLKSKNIIISIMAGITIQKLENKLEHPAIIRAMPNTPAQVGMGVTGFTASKTTSIEQIRIVENLLNTTGKTVFFEDGSLLDAVTALSGSGPAYFFYFLKNLVEAGEEMGLDTATATMLVNQTMLGSFHLFNSSTKSLDELIASVTSKGGTTEAAFQTLNQHKLDKKIKEAVLNAEKRAKKLSKIS